VKFNFKRSVAIYLVSLIFAALPADARAIEDTKKAEIQLAETPKVLMPPLEVSIEKGMCLYIANCAACHGPCGLGDGMARIVLKNRPRNFRDEQFHWVSSDDGNASMGDLARTIRFGRREAEMPAFPYLLDEDIRSLDLYVRSVNRDGVLVKLTYKLAGKPKMTPERIAGLATKHTKPGTEVPWSRPSSGYQTDTAKGRALFSANCASCHGVDGRGNGEALKNAKDSDGNPIIVKARDLVDETFHGGSQPIEVFRRIRSGISGTIMPAQKSLSDNDVWQLVQYVQRLSKYR
jgi:mono/diheme cytochrome c family protein